MQPLFEHRMRFAGFETRVLELEDEAPGLLLLHGWADSADTWRPVLAALGRADRRGGGRPPGVRRGRPPRGGGLRPAPARPLRRRRRRLRRRGGPGRRRQLAARPLVRTLLSLPTPVPEAVVRALVGRAYRLLVFGDQAAARPELVAAFTRHHRTPAAVAGYLSTGRRMLPELEEGFGLQEIRCPVLLVWGERDRMVSPRGAQLVRQALPGARVELLDGVGHCPQLEAPERLVELLLEPPEAWPLAA